MSSDLPILYSFRRCPYAMRARLALASARIEVEHREISLRDKPAQMLVASPKATVPVLVINNRIIDESIDIMFWALGQNDPENWLEIPESALDLISDMENQFKPALDRYKYANRFANADPVHHRGLAAQFLYQLDTLLGGHSYLFGSAPRLPDMAIVTFVRQFAHVDLDWFNNQSWVAVAGWLDRFKSSDRFNEIMQKHPIWVETPDATQT